MRHFSTALYAHRKTPCTALLQTEIGAAHVVVSVNGEPLMVRDPATPKAPCKDTAPLRMRGL